MRMYHMKAQIKGFKKTCNLSLVSVAETEKDAFERPEPLSESYAVDT